MASQNTPNEKYTVPLWINGKEETRPSTFAVISPTTNTTCWTASNASKDDARNAITIAATAFKTWRNSKPAARQEILLKAAEHLEKNSEEYAEYMCTEMGAELPVAQGFVLPVAIGMMRDIAARISSVVGNVPVAQQQGRSAMVWKEPYGVVLGIVPW